MVLAVHASSGRAGGGVTPAIAALLLLVLTSPTWAACKLTKGPIALPEGIDLLQNADGTVAVYSAQVRRDVDGALNAYHPCGANFPDNVCTGGNFGLDHICSGVGVRDAAGNKVPPSELDPITKKPTSARCLRTFREAAAAGFPECGQKRACVERWPGIVRATRDPAVVGLQKQIPILRPPGAAFAGYYVSQTTLGRADPAAPGGTSYLDARKVPYIVVPGSSVLTHKWSFGSATSPDLALIVQREQDGPTRGVFAVIGDTGPKAETGEGSVALLGRLRGLPKDQLDLDRPTARALPSKPFVENATYILFKASGHLLKDVWPSRDLTAQDIRVAGQKALEGIGGLAALAECAGLPSNVESVQISQD